MLKKDKVNLNCVFSLNISLEKSWMMNESVHRQISRFLWSIHKPHEPTSSSEKSIHQTLLNHPIIFLNVVRSSHFFSHSFVLYMIIAISAVRQFELKLSSIMGPHERLGSFNGPSQTWIMPEGITCNDRANKRPLARGSTCYRVSFCRMAFGF